MLYKYIQMKWKRERSLEAFYNIKFGGDLLFIYYFIKKYMYKGFINDIVKYL